MKKSILITLICVLSLYSQAQNLITNSDFEVWTDQQAMPDSWARGAGSFGVQYLYATDAQRNNVIRLNEPDENIISSRRFHSLTNISIPSAGTYRVSFWVKGNVGLRAVVLTKGDAAPSTNKQSATNHATLITGYPSGTQVAEWTKISTDIIVPSSATFGDDYRLHISWSSNTAPLQKCDFLIDDVQVIRLSDDGLNSISIKPKDYTTSSENIDYKIPGFSSEVFNYTLTTSYIDIPEITAEAANASSSVEIIPATSLSGSKEERTTTITVTTLQNIKTIYTVEFIKHPGFISGITWETSTSRLYEWSEMMGLYSKASGKNNGLNWGLGNTAFRCLSASDGFYVSTPVLENGASILTFYMKNEDIANDQTPLVIMTQSDVNPNWTEIERINPITAEWSDWKKVTVNINDNSPGLRVRFEFEKETETSGTVFLDDILVQPFGYTSTKNIKNDDLILYTNEGSLYIKSSDIKSYEIFDLNGVKVNHGMIQNETKVKLNRGVYLIKAGNVTHKIVL